MRETVQGSRELVKAMIQDTESEIRVLMKTRRFPDSPYFRGRKEGLEMKLDDLRRSLYQP